MSSLFHVNGIPQPAVSKSCTSRFILDNYDPDLLISGQFLFCYKRFSASCWKWHRILPLWWTRYEERVRFLLGLSLIRMRCSRVSVTPHNTFRPWLMTHSHFKVNVIAKNAAGVAQRSALLYHHGVVPKHFPGHYTAMWPRTRRADWDHFSLMYSDTQLVTLKLVECFETMPIGRIFCAELRLCSFFSANRSRWSRFWASGDGLPQQLLVCWTRECFPLQPHMKPTTGTTSPSRRHCTWKGSNSKIDSCFRMQTEQTASPQEQIRPILQSYALELLTQSIKQF